MKVGKKKKEERMYARGTYAKAMTAFIVILTTFG